MILDTNVFINALTGRAPAILRTLQENLPRMVVAVATRAELAWVRGRLDPDHPGTNQVVVKYDVLLEKISPAQVLVPDDSCWLEAGELAGHAARVMAGGGRRIATAFDRTELISDALIAILARSTGYTLVTEDKDFAVFERLVSGLHVLFYTRPA